MAENEKKATKWVCPVCHAKGASFKKIEGEMELAAERQAGARARNKSKEWSR